MLQSPNHLHSPPLAPLQQVHAFPVLGAPELDAGGISPDQSRGAESPPLPCWPHCFWCSPQYGWPFGLWAHIAASCPVFHPPVPPSYSPQSCLQSTLTPACICTWDCPSPCAGPCTWPCWTSWGLHSPTSQVRQGPSGLLWSFWIPLKCSLNSL